MSRYTMTPNILAIIVCVSCCATVTLSLPPIFQAGNAKLPRRGPAIMPQDQAMREMCEAMCYGETRYLCPIGCQVKGLYSNKRGIRGSIFNFNSKERDRAQSFDDKMFMELLGRKYDAMA